MYREVVGKSMKEILCYIINTSIFVSFFGVCTLSAVLPSKVKSVVITRPPLV